MSTSTDASSYVDAEQFLREAVKATTIRGVESLLSQLPIVSEHDYEFDSDDPRGGWKEDYLHWVPVGRQRGNAGRIKLGTEGVNPIAERLVNGMEAIIEEARAKEVLADSGAPMPQSSRAAVTRYFGIPHLDELPKIDNKSEQKRFWDKARALSRRLRARLIWDEPTRSFTVAIEDEGIGQAPAQLHATLLSLGDTTKGGKPYLIGVFGQGGSSAYQASKYSCVLSRRSPTLLGGEKDGVGWSVVKHIFPKNRRDDFYAYLAVTPDGQVLSFSPTVGDAVGVRQGTRFVHIKYDFEGGSAIARRLYQALNHVLYNPVLPFELYVGKTEAIVWGNSYRLSRLKRKKPHTTFDKTFEPQHVGIS